MKDGPFSINTHMDLVKVLLGVFSLNIRICIFYGYMGNN